mmetsp:Transcript_170452/g.546580  ORF Transcript_170452/g.546580 Transcript_170452/m.546580 type:complete len:415 (+) Transcript_170452:3-1247(+)
MIYCQTMACNGAARKHPSMVRHIIRELVRDQRLPVQLCLLGQKWLDLLPSTSPFTIAGLDLVVGSFRQTCAAKVPDATRGIPEILLILVLARDITIVRQRAGSIQPIEAVQRVPLADAGTTLRRRHSLRLPLFLCLEKLLSVHASAEVPNAVVVAPPGAMALRAPGTRLRFVVAADYLLLRGFIFCAPVEVVGGEVLVHLVGLVEPSALRAGPQLVATTMSLEALARLLGPDFKNLIGNDATVDVDSPEAVQEVGEGLALQPFSHLQAIRDVEVRVEFPFSELRLEFVEPHRRHPGEVVHAALELVLRQSPSVRRHPPHVGDAARLRPQHVAATEPRPQRLVGVLATPASHGLVVAAGHVPPPSCRRDEATANDRDRIGLVVVPPEVGVEIDVTLGSECAVCALVPFVHIQVSN